MSNSELLFPYLGDNPVQVARLSDQLTAIGVSMGLIAESLSDTRAQIKSAWIDTASDLCDADIGVLANGLPTIASRLATAQAAVTAYHDDMSAGRREVDDIRVRWDHGTSRYDQAKAVLDGLIGSTDPADLTKADSEKAEMQAANTLLEAADADYQALALKSNNSATNCSRSLAGTWNSTGQPSGGSGPSAGTVFLMQGGMDGTALGLLHSSQMSKLAAQAQADLAGINDAGLSPEERNARITAILQDYSYYAADSAFATALATGLGQGYFRDLESELAGYQSYWGSQDGNEQYQLDSGLFRLSTQVLAAATDSSQKFHVDGQWMSGLTHDDRGQLQPGWVTTISDYFRTDVRFSHDLLDSVGQDAIDWEKSRPEGTGDPWHGYGADRFFGKVPYSDPPVPTEYDPLAAIMAQYAAHPDLASTLFSSGAIDPNTGHPADPAQGNLMWLLHRHWDDDGQQLGTALDGMTSPAQGNPQAAGALAYDVLAAVGRGDDGLGLQVPWPGSDIADGARNGVANIAARYMGSILEDAGGQNPDANGLFVSGLGNEGKVADVDFGWPPVMDAQGRSTPNGLVEHALQWIYADTDNTGVRSTLYSAWLTSSGEGAAQDLQAAEVANNSGDVLTRETEVQQLRSHTKASAQVLGLLTGTDVQAFQDADRDAAAGVDSARAQMKTGAVVLKEIIGATGVPGRILSAGIGIFNNMLVDDVGNVQALAEAYNSDIVKTDSVHMEKLSASVLTALSSAGIPMLSVIDPVTGLAVDQTAVVQNLAVSDPHHLFTDSAGRLLPYEQIYAIDPTDNLPENPQRQKDFEDWLRSADLFSNKTSWADYEDEVVSGYQTGISHADF